MGVPYEIPPMVTDTVTGVGPHVVEIDWPDRSTIQKVIVDTKDGAREAFTVALYNHPIVDHLGSAVSDSVGEDIDDVGEVSNDCFRVSGDLAAGSNGKLMYFSESSGSNGFVFFGQKPKAGRQGQRASKLYLVITPVSGGQHRYSLVVGGMKEVE